MTIAQLRLATGQQIGLGASFDGSVAAYRELDAAEQVALTKAMFEYIKNNPQDFTAGQNATVNAEWSRVQTLDAAQPSGWAVFSAAIEDEALAIGQAAASVGQGVTTSINLVGTLLPLLAILAIAVFAWPYISKATAAPAAPPA